jgi:hypothetical protein
MGIFHFCALYHIIALIWYVILEGTLRSLRKQAIEDICSGKMFCKGRFVTSRGGEKGIFWQSLRSPLSSALPIELACEARSRPYCLFSQRS